MNVAPTPLHLNILEAAFTTTHQFAHHFFDCNSYYKYTVLMCIEFLILQE